MTTTAMHHRRPRALGVFTERRTWGEFGYALAGLPQGIAFFVFTVVTVTLSGGLAITFIGLPLMAVTGLASRYVGDAARRGGNRVLGDTIPAPAPFVRTPGLFGWIGSCLRDGTAWRARGYMLLKLPMGILSFVTTVVFWAYGLGSLTYAIWRPFLPCQRDGAGVCHRGTAFGNNYYIDTPFRIVWFAAAGALLLLAAPWVTKAVVAIDRAAARALLGPTRSQRVAQLETSRAVAVDDAATTLRRIERDLHDGTQARLVALAMNVGLAKEKLAEGADPAEAQRLLDNAHVTAKQAIAEVRDLARGIHPPVLDAGLDAALATLAAHSAVPVTVHVSLASRPVPAVETIAYFCVAELITNVAKHSGASRCVVDVTGGPRLVLVVRDDGRGGAVPGRGSGLRGLTDRVSTVDGTIDVVSPVNGGTTVTVTLPMELPS